MKVLICLFSSILDVLLLNVLRFKVSNLSFFYPMFTLTSIVYFSSLYNNASRKNYFFIILLSSIVYDSLAVGNLLITVFTFEVIGYLNIKLRNNFHNNLFNLIVRLLVSLLVYELIFSSLLVIVGYKDFNIYKVIYKYINSITINVIYLIMMFFVLKNKRS